MRLPGLIEKASAGALLALGASACVSADPANSTLPPEQEVIALMIFHYVDNRVSHRPEPQVVCVRGDDEAALAPVLERVARYTPLVKPAAGCKFMRSPHHGWFQDGEGGPRSAGLYLGKVVSMKPGEYRIRIGWTLGPTNGHKIVYTVRRDMGIWRITEQELLAVA